MKKITSEEIKKMQLEMLEYIQKICKEHNINYYASGGTLLGAVRHSGYIPWDDDIDIFVLYKDYKQLIDILVNDDKYDVVLPEKTNNVKNLFAKLCYKNTIIKEKVYKNVCEVGVFLDIFPLYNMPDDDKEREKYVSKICSAVKRYNLSIPRSTENKKSFFRKMLIIMYITIHPNWKKQRWEILKLAEKYQNCNTEYIGYPMSVYGKRDVYKSALFRDSIKMKFENLDIECPIGYDEYLKSLYGDYMKLPPVEKRINHSLEAYYIEEE